MQVRPGDRVKLINMPSDPDPIQPGSTGTVTSVTSGSLGQVLVRWDNGRSLALIPGIDIFQLISDEPTTQQANHGRVKIPANVLAGLEAVRQCGATNMLDRDAVQRIARGMGFEDAADWLADRDNHRTYAEGIFRGFVPEE